MPGADPPKLKELWRKIAVTLHWPTEQHRPNAFRLQKRGCQSEVLKAQSRPNPAKVASHLVWGLVCENGGHWCYFVRRSAVTGSTNSSSYDLTPFFGT
jgi:hypothetical protein